jgi:hypothetical protein
MPVFEKLVFSCVKCGKTFVNDAKCGGCGATFSGAKGAPFLVWDNGGRSTGKPRNPLPAEAVYVRGLE